MLLRRTLEDKNWRNDLDINAKLFYALMPSIIVMLELNAHVIYVHKHI